jgi:3-phosphoshikimate 1-carboxyvinyltransferase
LILGALTVGETRISGLLEGEDVLNTAQAMRALGARIERTGDFAWSVRGVGVGGFAEPKDPLDFGNSGTGAGWRWARSPAARSRRPSIGDASLRGRPMRRVLDPAGKNGRTRDRSRRRRPPAADVARRARPDADPVTESPVPSAQIKSAVLLAGLSAPGETTVIETEATRDHTERLLKHFGAKIGSKREGRTWPPHRAAPASPNWSRADVVVPADPSSAAFPMVAALIVPKART